MLEGVRYFPVSLNQVYQISRGAPEFKSYFVCATCAWTCKAITLYQDINPGYNGPHWNEY